MRSKLALAIGAFVMLLMIVSTTSVTQAQVSENFEFKVGQAAIFWMHEDSRWIHGDIIVGNNSDGDYFTLNRLWSVQERFAMTIGGQVVEANDTDAVAYAKGRVNSVSANQSMASYYQSAPFYSNVTVGELVVARDRNIERTSAVFEGFVALPFGRQMPIIDENSTCWEQYGSVTWIDRNDDSHTLLIFTAVRNHRSFTMIPINDSNGDLFGYGYLLHAYGAVAFVRPESGRVVRFEEHALYGLGTWTPNSPLTTQLYSAIPGEEWVLPENQSDITYFGGFFDVYERHTVATVRTRGAIDEDMGAEYLVPPAAIVGDNEFAPEDVEDNVLIDETIDVPEVNEDELTENFTSEETVETNDDTIIETGDDTASDALIPFDAGAMLFASGMLALAALGARRRC